MPHILHMKCIIIKMSVELCYYDLLVNQNAIFETIYPITPHSGACTYVAEAKVHALK